jgi:hypothetical protein
MAVRSARLLNAPRKLARLPIDSPVEAWNARMLGYRGPPQPSSASQVWRTARKIAAALNERQITTPSGGVWHAATVTRVQKRLGLA